MGYCEDREVYHDVFTRDGKMVFDGLCEHFTYKYIYICEEYEGSNHLLPRLL